jgi:heptosyltransferase III
MHIVLSRSDSIGDVVLTLPMAGAIKEKFPEAKISFIGRKYTEPVIKLSKFIDSFINWDEFETINSGKRAEILKNLKIDWIIHVFPNRKIAKAAKRAGIPQRVGTSHRTFHWTNCNRLVSFSRKKSELHEAQLNFKLIEPLGIDEPTLEKLPLYYGFILRNHINKKIESLIDKNKINLVLHPKSKGSAREWGLENFQKLIDILPGDKYKIFVSGTGNEALLMKDFLSENNPKVVNITDTFSLEEFILFLSIADGIVAASTGPLHIAAGLGKFALGIYPSIKPMHPGRWAPLGGNAYYIVKDAICNDCLKQVDCHCMHEITPEQVKNKIVKFFNTK